MTRTYDDHFRARERSSLRMTRSKRLFLMGALVGFAGGLMVAALVASVNYERGFQAGMDQFIPRSMR